MKNKILRLPEVIARTGLSRTNIYLQMSKGTFPQQKKLGPRSVGWLEAKIEKWILYGDASNEGGANE